MVQQMTLQQLTMCLESSHVNRCHVVYKTTDTIGRHTLGVILLCEFLTNRRASRELLMAAAVHDLPELITGDTPTSAKWRSAELKTALDNLEDQILVELGVRDYIVGLSERETAVLKMADLFELLYFALMEIAAGNTYASSIFYKVQKALNALLNTWIKEEIFGERDSEIINARHLLLELTVENAEEILCFC